MSHLHFPDGVLPLWLWMSGYLLAGGLIAVLWRWRHVTAGPPRQFALLGAFAALMLLIMSLQVPLFPYHMNLTVVSGIVLGPALAVVAVLLVSLLLAFVGHGGITVVGLNTLVLAVEILAGVGAFRLLTRQQVSVSTAAFVATVVGLALGTATSFAIIIAAAPWINTLLNTGGFTPHGTLEEAVTGVHLNVARLAAVMFGLGAIGWVLEGLVSAAVLRAIHRVLPNLQGHGE